MKRCACWPVWRGRTWHLQKSPVRSDAMSRPWSGWLKSFVCHLPSERSRIAWPRTDAFLPCQYQSWTSGLAEWQVYLPARFRSRTPAPAASAPGPPDRLMRVSAARLRCHVHAFHHRYAVFAPLPDVCLSYSDIDQRAMRFHQRWPPSRGTLANDSQWISVGTANASPEVLEPDQVTARCSEPCVLDIAMAKVGLQGSRIVALVGRGRPTSMTQHVGVGLKRQLRFDASPSMWRLMCATRTVIEVEH